MNKVSFKFALEVELPCAGQIRANDRGTADLIVVGVCDIDNLIEVRAGNEKWLQPCNIFAWGCINPISDTPPSAWFPIRTSDVMTDRAQFREFYDSVEYEINQVGAKISDYEETVIAYFTKPVNIQKTTTYEAI